MFFLFVCFYLLTFFVKKLLLFLFFLVFVLLCLVLSLMFFIFVLIVATFLNLVFGVLVSFECIDLVYIYIH